MENETTKFKLIEKREFIWQFVAELKDFKPRIWRRFQVRSDIALQDFCYVFMSLFKCMGSHLYDIRTSRNGEEVVYSLEQDDFFDYDFFDFSEELKKISGVNQKSPPKTVLIENAVLSDVFKNADDVAVFEYDFGDGWEFKITLENEDAENKIPQGDFATCLTGKGYGIIEDGGGVYGLSEIRNALNTGEPTENFECMEHFEEWLSIVSLDKNQLLDKGLDHFEIDDINEEIEDIDYLRKWYSGELFK